jgi:DNA polymerase I-like protein with 3'-5' exonuclease and polymerase domains
MAFDGLGGSNAPHIVFTVEGLQEIVRAVEEHGEFCFDVETRGVVSRHPDVLAQIEDEWKLHSTTLKSTHPDVLKRSKDSIVERWTKTLALDPLRNEVIWLGIAVTGKSWVIPVGHPNGSVLEPALRGDGSTVPPPGYRKVLKSGKESLAKASFFKPAVFSPPPEQLPKSVVFDTLRPIFFGDAVKIGHNVKFDARSVRKYFGGDLPTGPFYDTMLIQHVLNENLMAYSLEALIALNFEGFNPYNLDGKLGAVITEVPFLSAARYLHLDVRWTWLLYQKLMGRLVKDPVLMNCFTQDSQVLRVLMAMEDNGIPVNHRAMKTLGKNLDRRLDELMLDMYQYAPVGFNPGSTRHRQDLLFAKKAQGGLGLKPSKLTPGGQASVDEETLRKLEDKHPVIPMLLEYSDIKKSVSTYVDGLLPQLVKGRLHPNFNLHRTVTGRLSASNPNLQNIPRDSDIRSLFVAPDEYTLLVADYDQIELRIMCMFSQDKKMSEFFLTGADIHAGAAALCLGKDLADITAEERQMGKGANFLAAYGGGATKLAKAARIPEDLAKQFLAYYNKQFIGITKWKRQAVAEGVAHGYVTTMSGRRRRLPDLRSSDDGLRARAERQAVNAIVQGTASDICKQAMVACYDAFQGTDAQMLVQVHDELVVAVPSEQASDMKSILTAAMGDGRVNLGIPLKVSCHSAHSWDEGKGK